MKVRFAYDNLIDYSQTVITAATESATLPVKNVQNHLRTKVYRTGNTQTGESIVFDLGAAKTAAFVAILNHNLKQADTGIRLQANSSNSWATPPFTQTLTWRAGPISAFFSPQTYQFWRVSFTKTAASETRDIGRIFIGPYYEPPDDIGNRAISITQNDTSKTSRTIGGQSYSDIRGLYETVTVNFKLVSHAQHNAFKDMAAKVGTHTPFFFMLDYDVEPEKWLYYVKFSRLQSHKATVLGGVYYWDVSMRMDEQL